MFPFGKYVRLPSYTGWGYSKDLPRFARRSFRDRFPQLGAGTGMPVLSTGQLGGQEENTQNATLDRASLVLEFSQEIEKVNGNITHTAPDELSHKVIELLRARNIDQIHLEPEVLNERELQEAGIIVSHTSDSAIRLGITKAICGLADTGSILVADGAGHPLHASLLPQIHVAVLSVSDILPSLADAMRLPVVRESRASVVITGPSRTADIEMSLTIGMHGPAELHIFLVYDTGD